MDLFFAICTFVFGLAFGSFLNVVIYRLPLRKSVVYPGSACPKCHRAIRAYDNIPVLSWFILRGKCRDCAAPISPRYWLVELLVGVLFLACYLKFGFTLSTPKFCAFSFLLVGLIFIDAEWKLLPDKLTLTGLVIGLGFSIFVPVNDLLWELLPGMVRLPRDPQMAWRLLSFSDAMLGALIGASFIFGVGAVYQIARGVEGMGFGDVKLMAMVGAFFGVRLTVFTIFAGSLLGSIFGAATIFRVWRKRTERRIARNRESRPVARKRAFHSAMMVYRYYQMPFGVFLGGMALFALFFGHRVMSWYWSLYW